MSKNKKSKRSKRSCIQTDKGKNTLYRQYIFLEEKKRKKHGKHGQHKNGKTQKDREHLI
jgi:hypothetical protein